MGSTASAGAPSPQHERTETSPDRSQPEFEHWLSSGAGRQEYNDDTRTPPEDINYSPRSPCYTPRSPCNFGPSSPPCDPPAKLFKVLVVSLHHGTPADIRTLPVSVIEIPVDGTVQNVLDEYRSSTHFIEAGGLTTLSSTEIIPPPCKIAFLAHLDGLILCADATVHPGPRHKTVWPGRGDETLWPIFVVSQTLELELRDGVTSHYEVGGAVLSRWIAIDDATRATLRRQQELLDPWMRGDEIDLRSFFTFYHQPLHGFADHDFIFAVRRWREQGPVKLAEDRREAARSQERYPLPAMPTASTVAAGAASTVRGPQTQPQTSATEQLADEVARGLALLKRISERTAAYGREPYELQVQQVDKVIQMRRPEVKIALVGAPGAGKSSLINSLLNEAALFPTGVGQPCTAVVTEFRYVRDRKHPYHATVNFITEAEWAEELKVLVEEAADRDESRRAAGRRLDTEEARAALAKLRAVYPTFSPTDIIPAAADALLKQPFVADVLGKSKHFREADASRLSAALKKVVTTATTGAPAYWPLVKSIQISMPSELLEAGLILVDLPGGHDNNNARASVAQRYLQECSHIWVVTPLTHAINLQTTKNLLGPAFKQQMTLDGTFDTLTFVGTKSDDNIGSSREEASAFGIVLQIDHYDRVLESITKEIHELLVQLDWPTLTFTPTPSSGGGDDDYDYDSDSTDPEMTGVAGSGARKRQRVKGPSNDADIPFWGGTVPNQTRTPRQMQPWQIDAQKTGTQAKIEVLRARENQIRAQIWRLTVAARNETATAEIRSDFVAGLREYNREFTSEQGDSDPSGPAEEVDSLDGLPVFCVSARGFNRLSGNPGPADASDYFDHPDQTGLPALIEHAAKLVRATNEVHLQRQHNRIQILLKQLQPWSRADRPARELTENEIRRASGTIGLTFTLLRDGLLTEVNKTVIDEIEKRIHKRVYKLLPKAAKAGRVVAVKTATGWALQHIEGGMRYPTFKAAVRRGGAYSDSNGSHNLNEQLLNPMMRVIVRRWSTVFKVEIPEAIRQATLRAEVQLNKLNNFARLQADPTDLCASVSQLLLDSVPNYRERLADIFAALQDDVQARQKAASRALMPEIQARMMDGYIEASAQRGRAASHNTREAVMRHINTVQWDMFERARQALAFLVDDMVNAVWTKTLNDVQLLCDDLERDCLCVLKGQAASLDLGDQIFRREIRDMLQQHHETAPPSAAPPTEVTPLDAEDEGESVDLGGSSASSDVLIYVD